MIDIDAEVHVIILTFLKEQTFNWFFLTTRVHWMNMFQYVQAWPSVGLGSGRGKLSCSLMYKELKLFQAFLNPVSRCGG